MTGPDGEGEAATPRPEQRSAGDRQRVQRPCDRNEPSTAQGRGKLEVPGVEARRAAGSG